MHRTSRCTPSDFQICGSPANVCHVWVRGWAVLLELREERTQRSFPTPCAPPTADIRAIQASHWSCDRRGTEHTRSGPRWSTYRSTANGHRSPAQRFRRRKWKSMWPSLCGENKEPAAFLLFFGRNPTGKAGQQARVRLPCKARQAYSCLWSGETPEWRWGARWGRSSRILRPRDLWDLGTPPKLCRGRSLSFGPLSLVVSASGPADATFMIKERAAHPRFSPVFCPPSISASRISRARWQSTFTPPPPLFRCPLRAPARNVLARMQACHHRLHP